ncbi:MAG: cytochrome b/b6 domain-containing protein [Methylophilaceae bacterium]
MNTTTNPESKIKVWDPIVRIGHWTLVIAFFTAYFTGEGFLTQHVWAGYIVGGVIAFRILWGFIGSKHAQFKDFIYSPSTILAYLKGLISRKPQHYIGHNPAGGIMVIVLIAALSGTIFTGLKLYAVEENKGPLSSAQFVAPAGTGFINEVKAEEEIEADESAEAKGDKQGEDYWEGLHEFFVNFTLLLVVLHISGVIFSSYVDKENLVKAMFTGNKHANPNQD